MPTIPPPGDPANRPSRAGKLCGSPKKNGGTCGNTAGQGTDHVGFGHCRFHGGRSPGGIKMAQREQAYDAVRTFGLPVDIDPAAALLQEVKRSAGIVDYLSQRVAELEADEVVWSRALEREQTGGEFPGFTTEYRASVNVWVQLYAAERRHLAEVCAKAIQAGVAERQVRVAEEQGRLVGDLLRAIIDGLPADQRAGAYERARAQLALIQGASA